MPIRFRCVYCNQLLGISRRKAGTIVRCTTCEGQLIVPDPSSGSAEAAAHREPAAGPPAEPRPPEDPGEGVGVFDAEEFDAFIEPLQSPSGGPAVAIPPAPLAKRPLIGPAAEPARTVLERINQPALVLNRRGLTIAAVIAVLGVGLSFAAGLWVGLASH